jgi:hypothetical protein
MSVPDIECGEELSEFIANLLYDACNPEERPLMLEEVQAPRRQRQKK